MPQGAPEEFYILALSMVENLGVVSLRKLIQHFGSAEELFRLHSRDMLAVKGMSAQRVAAIGRFTDFARVEQEFEGMQRLGIRPLAFTHPDFPQRLNHCPDAPVLLFVKGNPKLNADRMVSVVGTRKISEYGQRAVRDLIESMRPYGITVVSGLAYGVDILTHKCCLDLGLPTIAVLGHGLDRIYPASHSKTAQAMLEAGGLLSEFLINSKPDRENFPIRNRIVAGISDATIVVESGASGGSMITAQLAHGYNRDVFAVPGSIYSDRSAGCNRLIKTQVAAMLESARDLEYLLGWKQRESTAVQTSIFIDLTPEEDQLVQCLRRLGRSQLDQLSLEAGLPVSAAVVALLNLELKGLVRALPGKCYELLP